MLENQMDLIYRDCKTVHDFYVAILLNMPFDKRDQDVLAMRPCLPRLCLRIDLDLG